MHIVLTGAGGFLGSEILRQVNTDEKLAVTAVTSRKNLPDCKGVTWVSNRDFLSGGLMLDEIDVVINCAFPRNEDPLEMASGLAYVRQVLESVKRYEAKGFIDVSSQSVYSQKRAAPATEDSPVCLESKYAVAKYCMELLVESCLDGISYSHVRLASLIGAGFEQRLPNKLARKVASGEDLRVEDCGQRFGYMDIEDAAKGILCMARSCVSDWRSIYNLGVRGSHSIVDLAEVVCQVARDKYGVSANIDVVLKESETPLNSELNPSLFEESFGWKSKKNIKESISSIVDHEMRLRFQA